MIDNKNTESLSAYIGKKISQKKIKLLENFDVLFKESSNKDRWLYHLIDRTIASNPLESKIFYIL